MPFLENFNQGKGSCDLGALHIDANASMRHMHFFLFPVRLGGKRTKKGRIFLSIFVGGGTVQEVVNINSPN